MQTATAKIRPLQETTIYIFLLLVIKLLTIRFCFLNLLRCNLMVKESKS